MNYFTVYWIHEGMPYIDETKLYKCGCGGSPIVDFIFDYDKKKFSEVSIKCKECGITTQIVDNIDEAIEIWQNCFDVTHYHNEWCRFNDDDVCLGGFHGE